MQTHRLLLREFQPEDAIHLFEMNEDWDCIKVLEKLGIIYKETRNKNGVEWLILSVKNKSK